jgi:hypothetical protein
MACPRLSAGCPVVAGEDVLDHEGDDVDEGVGLEPGEQEVTSMRRRKSHARLGKLPYVPTEAEIRAIYDAVWLACRVGDVVSSAPIGCVAGEAESLASFPLWLVILPGRSSPAAGRHPEAVWCAIRLGASTGLISAVPAGASLSQTTAANVCSSPPPPLLQQHALIPFSLDWLPDGAPSDRLRPRRTPARARGGWVTSEARDLSR